MQEWLLIVLFVGIPTALPLAAFWYLSSRLNSTDHSTLYRYRIAGHEVAITGGLLKLAGVTVLSIWWLEWIMPLPLLPIFLVALFFLFNKNKNESKNIASKTSSQLLEEINSMAEQLKTAHARVQQLAGEVELTQAELTRKQDFGESLDREIDSKLKEAEEWNNLTDEQKKLLVQSVGEAVSNKSVSRIVVAIVGSIVLNIAATLIWTLLGSPGKDDLLVWFSKFTAM
ncbi:hypothetical protein RV040_001435 [Vibrio alginolyticus]|uniref:hypothetical protein n=1 Tax=Vibrio alginolyticus TaxID=663 RepID=UPI002809D8E9|nr:hypothetical protein [Vibrio alginolyticus]ELA9241756.1 hypothetical protein [Vibrio alginolyticus]ELK8497956.1 hypothetical protein [Vibrio alginolyticus]MBE3788246.1 hypothetical protein [Vibrio parahaemolyticus]